MIVDAHTHAWRRWPYEPGVPDAGSRGRVENLVHEMDAAGVDVACVVSAGIPGAADNNEYGAESAAVHPGRFLQFADIDSRFSDDYHRPGAADRLRRLIDTFQPAGISHYLAPEDDGWLDSAEGVEFLRVADERRMLLSLAAPATWSESIRSAARRFPTLPILINHLGVVMLHPGGTDEALRLVAHDEPLPNLFVKVSGYYYGSDRPWDYPYADRMHIVRTFAQQWGSSRMVWASDWPSLLPHHSYRQALQLLRDHARFLDDDDIARIQGGNMQTLLKERGRLA